MATLSNKLKLFCPTEMSTDAFREYFKPLEIWLQHENLKNGVTVGWENPPLNTICQKVRPN